MPFIFLKHMRDDRDADGRYEQRSEVCFVVKANDIHDIDSSNLRNKGVVRKARVQHAAVRSAFDGGSRKSRTDTSRHE